MKHRTFLSSTLVVVVMALVVACSGLESEPPATPQKATAVRVAQASVATLRGWRELPATVEPTRVARLASPAEGPVNRLLVREGDEVDRGALLVVIGRRDAALTSLEAARERLHEAEVDYARVEHLVATGAVPGEQLDRSSAALEDARAAVAVAGQASGDFDIRAPWAGMVSGILVEEGNYIAPRTPLVEVFDPASLVLRSYLPEAASLGVEPGTDVNVRFDALPGQEHSTEVIRVYPELNRQLRTRTIELAIPEGLEVIPGMFARLRLPVAEAREAVVVPASALVVAGDGARSVFVVEDGVAHLRTVEAGIEEGGRVQLLSGLEAGQQVVVRGHQKLKNGAHVRIVTPSSTGEATDGAKR